VKASDYWAVYSDIHEKVKLTFDREGISIPYPQMDVHQHAA
jgi:small conductance mechanosensitive channel